MTKKKVAVVANSLHDLQEEQRKYQTTAILYKRMPGDMILVTGFRNILTKAEIKAKYGSQVHDIYFNFRVTGHIYGVFRNEDGKLGIAGDQTGGVYPGSIYNKKEFSKLVVTIKSAGKLLAEIVAACKNGEVRTVEL